MITTQNKNKYMAEQRYGWQVRKELSDKYILVRHEKTTVCA